MVADIDSEWKRSQRGPCILVPLTRKDSSKTKGPRTAIQLWPGVGELQSHEPQGSRGLWEPLQNVAPVTLRRGEGGGAFIHRPPRITAPSRC